MPETTPKQKTLNLAHHFLLNNQPQKALALLDQPDNDWLTDTWFWHLRGAAYSDLNQPQKGAEACQQGLAIQPDNASLLYTLSVCLMKTGDLPAAEQTILRALEIMPNNSSFMARYAWFLLCGHQPEKAIQVIRRAQALTPDDAYLKRLESSYYALTSNPDKAQDTLKESFVLNPDDYITKRVLGTMTLKTNAKQGKKLLQSAFVDKPIDPKTITLLRKHMGKGRWWHILGRVLWLSLVTVTIPTIGLALNAPIGITIVFTIIIFFSTLILWIGNL